MMSKEELWTESPGWVEGVEGVAEVEGEVVQELVRDDTRAVGVDTAEVDYYFA